MSQNQSEYWILWFRMQNTEMATYFSLTRLIFRLAHLTVCFYYELLISTFVGKNVFLEYCGQQMNTGS